MLTTLQLTDIGVSVNDVTWRRVRMSSDAHVTIRYSVDDRGRDQVDNSAAFYNDSGFLIGDEPIAARNKKRIESSSRLCDSKLGAGGGRSCEITPRRLPTTPSSAKDCFLRPLSDAGLRRIRRSSRDDSLNTSIDTPSLERPLSPVRSQLT